MNLRKISLCVICLTIGFISCKKDDTPTIEPIEIRDRTEQQVVDMDSLNNYLETHYYNASDFVSNPNPSISDIIIKKVKANETPPVGYVKLKDAVGESKKTVYAETNYEYFVLKLNQGGGNASPTFADNVRVVYEGFSLQNVIFDSSVIPVLFDLTGLIPGWNRVLPDFNTAESFVENADGTVTYSNKGLGVMFLPSGLGYFSQSSGAIPAYSPIIFKFELLQAYQNDHDKDGVPSYLEDINGDGELFDNTDGDFNPSNGFPIYDYLDTDDDGDGILTIDEDINKDGNPRNDDSNGNGIPNYLDKTDVIKKQ
ncbi:MAG: hypothetical protein KDC97_03930 [Confluentibacter sp.]|nr:hypothetical protein [Confluentibacter sp.]